LTTDTSARSGAVASTLGKSCPASAGPPGLAEARQDLLDVAQEHRRRPDDEHAAAGDPVAVRVEQVGGAMESDGGLAGAGAALDDQDAGERRADDPVLLGLEGSR
jgi:hypothetical protein